jgi:hypothetical protein
MQHSPDGFDLSRMAQKRQHNEIKPTDGEAVPRMKKSFEIGFSLSFIRGSASPSVGIFFSKGFVSEAFIHAELISHINPRPTA